MALPSPNLDDRRFQQFVDDAKRYIQQRAPEWTDHNVSDPGVTLVETVAHMADQIVYRLNRVPEKNHLAFLDLVGITLFPPSAARTDVTFWLSAPQEEPVPLPVGTEVATVRTEGIDFPFPGYLQNIVRQVTLNFKPRNPGALKAEVFFLIRRDGSVTGFRIVTSSGNYAFDLEAQGAIEAAAGSFGALPSGFTDDILPVSFSFLPARPR